MVNIFFCCRLVFLSSSGVSSFQPSSQGGGEKNVDPEIPLYVLIKSGKLLFHIASWKGNIVEKCQQIRRIIIHCVTTV